MVPTALLSAYPRSRLSLPKRKEVLSFLSLPGEIRNRVYHYYFQSTFRCELVGACCGLVITPRTIKILSNTNTTKRCRGGGQRVPEPEKPVVVRFPRLRRATSEFCKPRPRGWLEAHGAIVLVCKLIHTETLSLLYQRITFVFEAPRRIIGFLHKTPKQNYSHVTRLHLYYNTYGSPYATSDVIWQQKYIESWICACKVASKSLVCLRELEIDACINEDAPKFDLRQKWLQPLWQFRQRTCGNGHEGSTDNSHALTTVKVRVKSRAWPRNLSMTGGLADACKHLHRLYGNAISKAILGAKEGEAMSDFKQAWNGKYHIWQFHLGFAPTGW